MGSEDVLAALEKFGPKFVLRSIDPRRLCRRFLIMRVWKILYALFPWMASTHMNTKASRIFCSQEYSDIIG